LARLYSNENFPRRTVEILRALGHDVLTSHESGKANQAVPDEDVLSFAADEERILITLNRKHFIRLHRKRPIHAGIVVCTFDPDFDALAMRIHEALESQPEMLARLVRVNRPAK
jgi:uncharacterized protein with PIN domain